MIEVRELEKTRRNIKKFILFAWKIYKNDRNFVPPLISDQLKIPQRHTQRAFRQRRAGLSDGLRRRKTRSRVLVGINGQLNRVKGYRQGYLSLFECVNDQAAADAILDAAVGWLKPAA